MLHDLRSEVRVGLRGLLRARTLSFGAIACLGLGIGASVAIYTAVHAALLRPLPFPDADRLVSVFRTTPQFESGPFAPANYLDLRRETSSLEGLAAIAGGVALVSGLDEPLRVSRSQSAGDLFGLLGVQALHGRLFGAGDEEPGAPAVAVISAELWRDRMGADPDAVGRTMSLNGEPHEIVGVLPTDFVVPRGNQRLRSDVWVPLRFDPDEASQRRSNYLQTTGRLADGVSVEEANAELRGVMAGIAEAHPELRGEQLRVVPMHRESVRAVRGPLILLLGAVGLVLMVALANVASLLLARGVGRREELAVRSVLGADGRALMRPVVTETLLLTAIGTAIGLALAWTGVRVIGASVPPGLPQLRGLEMDGGVLLFCVALGALVSFVCSLVPALQAGRTDPQDALRSGGRGGTGGRQHRWLRGLVAMEVGLSLVLLLAAGLVMRGFRDLVSEDPGFEPEGLLTLAVNVDPARYGGDGVVERFLEPALDRIRAVPGVREAGALNLLPYQSWGNNFNIRYEGQADTDPTRLPLVESRVATPGLFGAVGHVLESGRLPTREDAADEDLVVVVNRALVERDFDGEDPVGRRFYRGGAGSFARIVGVVRDIRNFGPSRPPQPEAYFSYRQVSAGATFMPIVVRVEGRPAAFAGQVTAAIRDVDPTAAISDVRPMTDVISGSVGSARFYLVLFAVFAAVALVLAVAGLYGVMSYAVAKRRRELGIRSALGSSPGRTAVLVLRQGLLPVTVGIVIGLPAALGLSRLLGSMLYGVSPLDPLTWVLVPVVLVLAALPAVLVPARRASTIAPLIAMRAE